MASFSFNTVDMSAYGVRVLRTEKDNLEREFRYHLLQERAYGWRSQLGGKRLVLGILVEATAAQNIHTLLSQFREKLNLSADCKLALDEVSGRYWWARFTLLDGLFISPKHWRGDVEFILSDPRAHADTPTVNDHSVDADPDTIVETPVGTTFVEPVYLFTAGENHVGITLVLTNTTTDEALTWEGDLANTEELEIDVEHWLVEKEGVADMADVSGKFPTLQPGANTLTVAGFGSLGDLKITYRAVYI